MDATSAARFKEGVAYAKQGKYEEARASFLQVLALDPTNTNVLLNLAIGEHALGRHASALGHLRTYLKSPAADPKKTQELYDELVSKTGHLVIKAAPGAAIVLDGDVKLGNAPLSEIVDVMPGTHVVTAGARTIETSVAAGETKDVLLVEEQPPAPPSFVAVVPPAPPAEAPPVEERPATLWGPLTLVFGGATLLAGSAALYFNAKSHEAAGDASTLRRDATHCGRPGESSSCAALGRAVDDQKSAADASKGFWIGTAAAAALTLTSATLWYTHRSRSTSGMIVPLVGPGVAGTAYRISF